MLRKKSDATRFPLSELAISAAPCPVSAFITSGAWNPFVRPTVAEFARLAWASTRIRSKIFRLRRQHFLRGLLGKNFVRLPCFESAIQFANFARSVGVVHNPAAAISGYTCHFPCTGLPSPRGATCGQRCARSGKRLFINCCRSSRFLSRTVSFIRAGKPFPAQHPSSVAARS